MVSGEAAVTCCTQQTVSPAQWIQDLALSVHQDTMALRVLLLA